MKIKELIQTGLTANQILEATTSGDVGGGKFVQHDFLLKTHPFIKQYGDYKCDYDEEGKCVNVTFETDGITHSDFPDFQKKIMDSLGGIISEISSQKSGKVVSFRLKDDDE